MPIMHKKVDEYIDKAQPFAQPVLKHIRALVHAACPDVEEKIKWGFPHFDYKGEMMCSVAAFKQHCSFSFWKGALMKDPALMENAKTETSMGHLGRITSLQDLPSDKKFTTYIKEAMKLNDDGKKVVKKPVVKKELVVPDYLLKVIQKNKAAYTNFEHFPPSHKREYIAWIEEAKTAATKEKRMAQMMELLAEGKPRNWKYMQKK